MKILSKLSCIFIVSIAFFCSQYVFADAKLSKDNTLFISTLTGLNINQYGDFDNPSINLTSTPKYNAGFTQTLGFGYRLNSYLSFELALGYIYLPMRQINNAIPGQVVKLKNSSLTVFNTMLNTYYNIAHYKKFIPYIGLGLGYAYLHNKIVPNPSIVSPSGTIRSKTLNINAFGYQFMLGSKYQLSQNLQIGLEYRYFSTVEASGTGRTNLGKETVSTKQDLHTQIIGLMFNYYFC